MKRRLTVTITKIRRQTTTALGRVFSTRCPVCECEVELVTLAEAARILQVNNMALDGLAAVHEIPTINDRPRICKASLNVK